MSDRDRAARPAWDGVIERPVAERLQKPRERGLTMVIDKGLGLNAIDDLMQIAAPVIDVLKLTFGTSAFFGHDVLKEKVRTVTAHGVHCMPGGTLQEVAVWQGALDRYLERARELGFDAIEISDGTIEMDARTRADAIAKAVKAGFRVLSEVGKKDPADAQPMAALAEIVNADLEGGASIVIMEAREAGKGVGIYDASGLPKEAEIEAFLAGVRDPDRILWEAPLGPQQRYLVLRFGPNVNLGNVAPEDVLALEALRCGLRGDTLKRAWLAAGADRRPPSLAAPRSGARLRGRTSRGRPERSMTALFVATLAALGFVGAFITGLVGVGGAVVMIPLLYYVPPWLGVGALDQAGGRRHHGARCWRAPWWARAVHGGAGGVHRPLAVIAGTAMAVASLAGAVASRYVGSRS